MPFPLQDPYWMQVRSFLERHTQPLDAILAPNEFLEFFPGNYHYNITYLLPADHFAFVVFHKAMLREIELPFVLDVIRSFQPVFANEVFVVYAKQTSTQLSEQDQEHVQFLLDEIENYRKQQKILIERFAITVTTHNRPHSLERSLPQFLTLKVPIVIVDDASTPENAAINKQIAEQHHIPLIHIPENRGLPNAMNVGISYWLADPGIIWISYFQDDVDVDPNLFEVLDAVQDREERPLLTGRDALEHPTVKTENIAGHRVLLKRSMPGQHLHAHRDYWSAVLPIPTPYLGAPKPDKGKPGQGADEDWWITAWSPNSITKRGKYVVCVPGLVRTFRPTAENSTWGNVSELPAPEAVAYAAPLAVDQTKSDRPVTFKPDHTLDGLHVLVDGYNLQLTSGTGIKTYGTSLVQALRLLEANVDVLLSRNSSKVNDVLDEVLFFDEQAKSPNRIRDVINISKGLVRSSLGPFYRAKRRKTLRQFVIKQGKFSDDFLKYAESFNLPQCYDVANAIYKYLHRETDIYVPEKIDIWHATYPLPIQVRGAKKITTMHDLIPLRLPYATLDDKEIFYYKTKTALKDSAVIISVSEHTKRDLLTYFEVDPNKIVVTYQPPVLEPLQPEEEEKTEEFLQRFKLQPEEYILFVGAIEPKKNLGRLLEAYATIDTDMPLVVVGKKAWSWEEELGKMQYLFDKDSKRQVKMLEYVSTNSLRYLYRGAYCFVFPSLYEGFGLPPVEAMSFGCPVVTSQVSSLPEVCGNGAMYVDPYDVADIKAKIEKLLGDRELRQQLSKNARKNARFFTMENYTKRLYNAYRQAVQ
ncbi:glycosyltransferase [Oscillatoria sp. FACHB-1407]|uniref:glycosyltransferase n=1 Tax=Oscillatoria sp. FACHB-1407 TaxID=2692847 RepID=UPI001689A619|nr:glycosyltransferase [Oscillatoria sp. FACHB-1407]MBD2464220.1 glycosyltransferase [Oscillatoria sp. FACHB-1407]